MGKIDGNFQIHIPDNAYSEYNFRFWPIEYDIIKQEYISHQMIFWYMELTGLGFKSEVLLGKFWVIDIKLEVDSLLEDLHPNKIKINTGNRTIFFISQISPFP